MAKENKNPFREGAERDFKMLKISQPTSSRKEVDMMN